MPRRRVGGRGFRVEQAWQECQRRLLRPGDRPPGYRLLGEYDALPGVSQDAVPTRKELERGGTGHGCGHNLLGAGAFAAAIGLKHELEKRNLPGTVKYFGCPAEENFSGKAFMARDGLFNDCDACLTWHAGSVNRVWTGSSLANNAVNVTFHGRTAHAAGDPTTVAAPRMRCSS